MKYANFKGKSYPFREFSELDDADLLKMSDCFERAIDAPDQLVSEMKHFLALAAPRSAFDSRLWSEEEVLCFVDAVLPTFEGDTQNPVILRYATSFAGVAEVTKRHFQRASIPTISSEVPPGKSFWDRIRSRLSSLSDKDKP